MTRFQALTALSKQAFPGPKLAHQADQKMFQFQYFSVQKLEQTHVNGASAVQKFVLFRRSRVNRVKPLKFSFCKICLDPCKRGQCSWYVVERLHEAQYKFIETEACFLSLNLSRTKITETCFLLLTAPHHWAWRPVYSRYQYTRKLTILKKSSFGIFR